MNGDNANADRSRKSAATRSAARDAVAKVSILQGRLASRALAGARKHALRRDPALTVKGIAYNRAWDVHPNDYDKLELPDYQRGIQPDEVNELIRVLQAGGVIPDPITLSNRKWKTEGKQGRYYIVDGQQRVLAHMEMQKVIRAIVYDCDSIESERQLFVILNTTRAVRANSIIAAASNKPAAFMRDVNEDTSHPCHGRIILKDGSGSGATNIGASIVMRGMAMAFGIPAHARGRTAQKLMPIMDSVWDADMADAFLQLIAAVTPDGDDHRLRLLVAMALGKVCAEKRKQYGRPVAPSRQSAANMRKVNWANLTMGTWAERFMPVVTEKIRELWKA